MNLRNTERKTAGGIVESKSSLATRMLEAAESDVWKNVILPYLEQERALQIENMASQTDAMQLMRYAGAAQAIGNLMRMEFQARQVLEAEMKKQVD